MEFNKVYFLGIGGIGMSALARYFLHEGKCVAGYDRTSTPLTEALTAEGAKIHYQDGVELIDEQFKDKATTLVVYTPAIPPDHRELCYFRASGFELVKRSEILGHIAANKYVMAVAGTHGKTTTTTMTAWFNHVAGGGGSAFLGGISKNFGTNLVLGDGDRLAVEADEFDRSFLRLYPDVAVITAADADHLDIYGTHEAVKEAFSQFVRQIKPGGALIIKKGVNIELDNPDIKIYRYSFDQECDFFVRNVTLVEGGHYNFDIVCPDRVIEGCGLGLPGWINIENAVAAVALLWVAGFDAELLKEALRTFSGVKRRFDFYINEPECVYMDDYAHHPEELRAAITSVKQMFPGRRLTAIFQPHLFTRTRDFYAQFAESLSLADQVVLLPIYPARELPIEGISSEMIGNLIGSHVQLVDKERVADTVARLDTDVVVSFGAGDIENYCKDIAAVLSKKMCCRKS